MTSRSAAVSLILLGLSQGPIRASHPDAIDLQIGHGSGPGEVLLTWSGGPPAFVIYRALSPIGLVSPPNQVGSTGSASWPDTPPDGLVFYEIASACDVGFRDCNGNPADGCESVINAAQSTSPMVYGGAGNADLKAGYSRVSAISDCGGCGITCDDGIPCTTDLCVPDGWAATCRHYDRAQCSEARCGDALPLPPGAPVPLEPACTGLDVDGDGLPAAWETGQTDPYTGLPGLPGVDLDCDGEISDADGDLAWHEPPGGDATKDLYLEYDYMGPGPGETAGHAPPPEAVSDVVAAFAGAGIALHVDPTHQVLPHAQTVYLPVPPGQRESCLGPGLVSLYDPLYKGSPANHDPRRRLGYRYFLFGHDSCYVPAGFVPPRASGMAEIFGNDAIVSLGTFGYVGAAPDVAAKRRREHAGTIIHELGHTLGLCHGGPGDPAASEFCVNAAVGRKPNHISSMNYSFQLNGILRSASAGSPIPPDSVTPRRVDFSHEAYDPLDENFLDEFLGVNATTAPRNRDLTRHHCGSQQAWPFAPVAGLVDWNCDQFLEYTTEDINGDGQWTTLAGASEWDGLFFRFQCEPTLADGGQAASRMARSELSLEQAAGADLRARPLRNCGTGRDCDGDDANGCETAGSTCSPVPTCSNTPLWTRTVISGSAAAPASDTDFNPDFQSFSYVTKGSRVYCILNRDMPPDPAGTERWFINYTTTPTAPVPARLLNGQQTGIESVFVADSGGLVHRIDVVASTGNLYSPQPAPFDTRRPSCSFDQVIATPAVQLWEYSNILYKSARTDDLVFILTRAGCDFENNRVIALRAADLTVAWIFEPNASLGLPMSYGSEACTVDYARNLLYCGTEQFGGQRTLWAIRTIDGGLQWSLDVGAIRNRPQVRGSRVYAATVAGGLWSVDASTGVVQWNSQVTTASIVRNPSVASGGGFAGLILMTDAAGFLHAWLDSGPSGGPLWGPRNLVGTVNSAPVLDPVAGKAYVGMTDGTVRQVNLADGRLEATATAGLFTEPVFDPGPDFDGSVLHHNRLTVAAGISTGKVVRFCIPWADMSMEE